ncbi:MAG: sporulation initiation factor Spo0A C-terminal domain-containing protein [bacterium]|nr:sporulation initiation factor Spo0A C-terminal domain-containing protein [bacterium]
MADNRVNLELHVTEVLHQMGVPARLTGYHYLREAIMMLVDDMEVSHSITKVLYYDVAKRHNSTTGKVERAIRTAVEVSWERGNEKVFEQIFGYSVTSGRKKPCNSEYMVQVADQIRLKRKYEMPLI